MALGRKKGEGTHDPGERSALPAMAATGCRGALPSNATARWRRCQRGSRRCLRCRITAVSRSGSSVLPLPRVPLALAAVVGASCLAGALAASFVHPAYAQDPQSCPNATPTAVTVDDVPIVTSTTAEYFVLNAQHQVDSNTTVELPVLPRMK